MVPFCGVGVPNAFFPSVSSTVKFEYVSTEFSSCLLQTRVHQNMYPRPCTQSQGNKEENVYVHFLPSPSIKPTSRELPGDEFVSHHLQCQQQLNAAGQPYIIKGYVDTRKYVRKFDVTWASGGSSRRLQSDRSPVQFRPSWPLLEILIRNSYQRSGPS